MSRRVKGSVGIDVPAARHDVEWFAREVEATLRSIDFPEVTLSDRVAFVQCAVAWQVRQAVARGRFDVAIRLRDFGRRRIADLRGTRTEASPGAE